ncbi:MAG: TraR/DksA family transcriptional regulator [bacterium]
MNKKERERFTRLILEERQRKLDALGRHQGDLEEIKGTRSAEYEEEVTLSDDKEYLSKLIEAQSRGLEDINRALERILEGTYGQCVRCGGDIGKERLEALPTVELCLECKRDEEESGQGSGPSRQDRVARINLPGEEESDQEELAMNSDDE